MAMLVEDIVRVTIVGMQRAIHLPPDLFCRHKQNGREHTYVKLMKSRSEIIRLLTQKVLCQSNDKRLTRTSIIETLIQLRDEKIDSIVDDFLKKDQKIDMEIDDQQQKTKRGPRWPQTDEFHSYLPEVIDIEAPAIGETQSCKIKALGTTHPGSAVYVELNQQTVDYLSTVVLHQTDAGEIHRRRKGGGDGEVSVPAGYYYSSSRNRLVKSKLVFSPGSNKKKRSYKFFKSVRSSSKDEEAEPEQDTDSNNDEEEPSKDCRDDCSSDLEEVPVDS